MLAALIQLNPKEILKIYSSTPININVPGKWQYQNAFIGYKTPDNLYEVVNVIPFTVPESKKVIGSASYSFNESGQVIETFETEDLPPIIIPEPQPITTIQAPDFINRFTNQEYSNIKNTALAQMQQGNSQLQKWIDIATAEGFIDLNRQATKDAKAALIQAQLLTQERADLIFSIQE